ncbi:hypothetical protein ACH33_09560 [Aneurinibacillus sp. XH2]|uniref:hypothetical protein n=1 Tax=Aneurinibacillus sp. XH2 TaxID=1450761 RepID=UPI000708E90D|nr:hypothetical protein [Aneurinibacillus sp. XH2]AMA73085.1 hypothetical protein ACH33_09560 [Aneurinibacillus sp. XH2]
MEGFIDKNAKLALIFIYILCRKPDFHSGFAVFLWKIFNMPSFKLLMFLHRSFVSAARWLEAGNRQGM